MGVAYSIDGVLSAIPATPPLSVDDERALFVRYRAGEARLADVADSLVRSNLPWLRTVVARYAWSPVPAPDLLGAAALGMVRAASSFDPDRGVRFITYAMHWVRACIHQEIRFFRSVVSTGMSPKADLAYRREQARALAEHGDVEAAHEAIARTMKVSAKRIENIRQHVEARDVSLEAPPRSGISLLGRLEASSGTPEEKAVERERAERLHSGIDAAVRALDDRERVIVARRLMADDEDRMTLADLGKLFGVSRERVRQLERRLIRRLAASPLRELVA